MSIYNVWGQGPDGRTRANQARRERHWHSMGHEGIPLLVDQIAEREHLYRSYRFLRRKGKKAPGVDGVRIEDLSPREVGNILASVAEDIRAGRYVPQPTRHVRIPKSSGRGTRVLQIPTVVDRIVATALQLALVPRWERIWLDCSWGSRQGRDRWGMLAALERDVAAGKTVLVQGDVRDAFSTMPIEDIIEAHRRMLRETRARIKGKELNRLLGLIGLVLRGNDRTRTRGIGQGNPYSPVAANAYFHYLLDVPLSGGPPSWYRYVDDLVVASSDVTEGLEMMLSARDRLANRGMDLRDLPSATRLERGETTHLTGVTVALERDRLQMTTDESGRVTLRHRLIHAYDEADPPQTAIAVIRGWVESNRRTLEDGASLAARIAADLGTRDLPGNP